MTDGGTLLLKGDARPPDLHALGQALGAYGSCAPGLPTPSTRAAQLAAVVDLLREHPEVDGADHFADAMERWLADGGDLQRMLGLRAARGEVTPQQAARREAMVAHLRAALETTTPSGPLRPRCATLALRIQSDDPTVSALAGAGLPTSPRQLVRLIRAAEAADKRSRPFVLRRFGSTVAA